MFDRLDISNRRKIIIYDHCAATKNFRVDVYVCVCICVCTNIVVHGWYKKKSRIASNDDFFFFHHLLLLLLRFIKGMSEVRSRGSKVQKNCAFIREDDARSIFILKFTFFFQSNRFLHAYLTLASFFSTPPPFLLFKSVFFNYIFLIASSISIFFFFFSFFFLVFK